ncbi:MAG: tRNA pseudouridine(13) synthase TruD [Planctomycetota bacterium]
MDALRFVPSPATFRVEEIPLYPPAGEGPHLWLVVQKRGIDTLEARKRLGRRFQVPARDIGFAGRKDAASTAVQVFTVPWEVQGPLPGKNGRRSADSGLRILSVSRHRHRLRVGHLAGNRFHVILRGDPRGAGRIAQRLRRASREGFPNAFGPQRFGAAGRNVERGREVLLGIRRGERNRLSLWLSALQAAVFQAVLENRIRTGLHLREGDLLVASARRSGGVRARLEQAPSREVALRRGILVPSGPLPGARTPWAEGEMGRMERETASRLGWPHAPPRKIAGVRLDGQRRPLVVHPWGTRCTITRWGVHLAFALPAGSYASALIRHLLGPRQGPSDRGNPGLYLPGSCLSPRPFCWALPGPGR